MKKKAVMILTLFCATILFGQKIKVTKGDYNFFKGQKNINVEFLKPYKYVKRLIALNNIEVESFIFPNKHELKI